MPRPTPHLRPLATTLIGLSLLIGCAPLTLTIGGPTGGIRETTVLSEPGHGGRKIAIIDVSGLILNGNRPGLLQPGENPVSLLHEMLARAEQDHRVKAVILRLNSPGGGVTASDLMYRELHRFKARSGKPVVAIAMDITASGGYYVACAADRILAQPTAVIGSIGVIAQTFSVRPLLDRFGVQTHAITSGPNKTTGSPLETLTDDHRRILQAMVDDYHARFLQVVRTRRPAIPADRLAEVTDGRIVSGDRALTLGLVDRTGDIYDAMAEARTLAGIPAARLITYHRPLARADSPYAAAPLPPGIGTQVNLAQLNLTGTAATLPAGFYYLWQTPLR